MGIALSVGMLAYDLLADDDEDPESVADKAAALPPEQKKEIVRQAQVKYPPGCKNRDMSLASKYQGAMERAAQAAGVGSWTQLPYTHPARVDYRAWYQCKPVPSEQGGAEAPEEEDYSDLFGGDQPAKAQVNQEVIQDAFQMYEALKGLGTDEEVVYSVLQKNSDNIRDLYNAYNKVLERKRDTESGDLIDWLRDDGENRAAMMVKRAMMGGS